jgi:hypothetical protein
VIDQLVLELNAVIEQRVTARRLPQSTADRESSLFSKQKV